MTRRLPPPRAGRVEIAALLVGLALVMYAVFGVPVDLQRNVPLAVLILPLMVWSAFRVDSRLTAALGIAMSVVGVYRTRGEFGPLAFDGSADALLIVQCVIGITTILLLAVAAEIGARRRIESELRTFNESLERRVEERTAEVTRLHARMVEAQGLAQIGSWEWNVESNTLWWSEEMCRIFGLTKPPSAYEPYLQLVHPEDREWTDVEIRAAMKSGRPFTFDHRIVRPDGDTRVIHANGRVEVDDSGAPRRLLGSGHDITERLQAERARAQLIEEQAKLREAEEASRAKDAFLATLSHELRTPLNAALGWTYILRETHKPGDGDHRLVEAIYRNLQLQSKIVSDILDISLITKGELPLDQQRVELRSVFESALDMLRETAAARGITIRIHGDGADIVVGDSRRLQQVAWNLMSNAVKFSKEGGTVTVSIVAVNDAVECSVEDDGPGIDPAFLPHVFEQFSQADSSTTRAHGGLGLGLAIAREIVVMHGGAITAANRAEGGAAFVVKLPASRAADDRGAAVPVPGARQARVRDASAG
jgi:PAS domain S-box-containing protein